MASKYHDPKSYAAYMPVYGEFGPKGSGSQQWKDWGRMASNARAMPDASTRKDGSQAAPVASRASATMREPKLIGPEAKVEKPVPLGKKWTAGTGTSHSHKEWAKRRTQEEKKSLASHTLRSAQGKDTPEPKLPPIKHPKSPKAKNPKLKKTK